MTTTLHRASYAYSEAAEYLNLPVATIIDMVNNGMLSHTPCGKRITRKSLQAAMAPESEQKWLHGKKSGGWIDWPGGECPVDGKTVVQVRFRGGDISTQSAARTFFWPHRDVSWDIVAYREVPFKSGYPLESRVRPVASGEQQPAEPEKQPQPGEWWEYSLKGLRGVAYCCGQFLNGRLLWQEHPKGGAVQLGESLIRHLPKCTGFDYVPPPEKTPAEKRLEEAGIHQRADTYIEGTFEAVYEHDEGIIVAVDENATSEHLRLIADLMEGGAI